MKKLSSLVFMSMALMPHIGLCMQNPSQGIKQQVRQSIWAGRPQALQKSLPMQFDMTFPTIKQLMNENQYSKALLMAEKLLNTPLLQQDLLTLYNELKVRLENRKVPKQQVFDVRDYMKKIEKQLKDRFNVTAPVFKGIK